MGHIGGGQSQSPVPIFGRSFFPSLRRSKFSIWLCDGTSALGDREDLLLMGNTAPLNHLCFSHVGASSVHPAQEKQMEEGEGEKRGGIYNLRNRIVWAMQWHPNIMCLYILPLAIINF